MSIKSKALITCALALTLTGCCHHSKHFAQSKQESSPMSLGQLEYEGSTIDDTLFAQLKVSPTDSTVHFDLNKTDIKEQVAVLKSHAEYLKKHPEAKIKIEAHADVRGKAEYNKKLAQKRADHIAALFEKEGVSKEQIQSISKGSEQPVAKEMTEEAHALNRRAVISVYS